jgi:hypothetical protein
MSLQLADAQPDSSMLLRRSLDESPMAELRKGQVWRIGNVEFLDDSGIYFAFGRTRKSAIERFDAEKSIFLQELIATAPYTHVFLDVDLQLAAIASESDLAPRISLIARRLAQVLSRSRTAGEVHAEIEESEIRDPESFITYLREAHAVRSFTFQFKPPNPFDVENEVHRPLERYLREARGERGTTTIQGRGLEPEVLERLSRSVASQGQNAKARVVPNKGGAAVQKQLAGNPVTFGEKPLGPDSNKKPILERARAIYRNIRGQE